MADSDLSDLNLHRLMWRLGLPAMAGLSLNALHQVVDAAFVGRLGADALAALVLLTPLAGLVAAAGIGLGIGAASATARSLGAGQPQAARAVAGLSFCAALVLAICACGGLLVFDDPLLRLLGAQGALFETARTYLTIQAFTIGCAIVQILCDFLAIGRGNARFSLMTLALCFGLNIILDPVFIFWLDLGVSGAAWSTLCAQLVSLGVWARHFAAPCRRPALGPLRLLWPVLRVGLPETASIAVTTLGLIALLRIAADLGGPAGVAALGITLRLVFVVMLPLEGFAIGVQPILSHAHGSANAARFASTLRVILRVSVAVTVALGALFCLAAHPLARLFVTDPAVADQAAMMLRCLAFALPAIALRLCAQISLQAMVLPWQAALLGLAPMGWLLWPAMGLLVPGLGLVGIAIAVLVAAWLAALLALVTVRDVIFPLTPTGASA
ncbi:MATE family efflux transporter [Sulfitobacter sp. DFL-23]|uniref:MATE family efflux transporter n=1 Tax=Sulfitobacter sp. DFL-23 TaxID=215829 RepID=UPI000DF25C59|nr:MATE family efflux transporter [Sulfitobacter sp. DFL-23]